MSLILGLFVAAMCGWEAYQYWKTEPGDLVAWGWTGAWGAAAVSGLLLAVI